MSTRGAPERVRTGGLWRLKVNSHPSSIDDPVSGPVEDDLPDMANPARVILVEDDESVADMYRLGLEYRGFEVMTVGSGAELFGTLGGLRPDIVVLDYQLPGPNGAEVLQMIRGDDRIKGAKVLMLSNFPPSHDGAVDRVFRLGAIAWLEKRNTSPDALAEKIAEALGRVAPSGDNAA